MKSIGKALLAAAGLLALSWSPASAIEAFVNPQQKPGIFIGASAGVPPPGIYMFNQVFTYQANLTGPGLKPLGGNTKIGDQASVDVQGFLFVPGWTFLGATYDAVIAQPFVQGSLGQPFNIQETGVHNTYIVPVELSWKLGDSGFAVKTGLGIFVPDGTQHAFIPGFTGSSVPAPGGAGYPFIGDPFWTFQPEIFVSYLKDGWNLSAVVYAEINTRNTATNYTTGTLLHADFTATKTIGKWTFGPVAYYVGQVSDDSCSAFTCGYATGTLLNPQRFDIWAVGGLVGYNFGPAALSVWATQEVSAKASNAAAAALLGQDFSLTHQGLTVFATLSYRLWGPDEGAKPATAPMYHK
jgi:hypothetical protein